MPLKALPAKNNPFTRCTTTAENCKLLSYQCNTAAEGVEVLDTELDVVVQENKPRLKLLGNATAV